MPFRAHSLAAISWRTPWLGPQNENASVGIGIRLGSSSVRLARRWKRKEKNSESYSRDAETRTPLARLARVSPGIVRRVLQGGRPSSNVIGGCLKVLPSVLQDAGSAKKKTASLTIETPKLERHWWDRSDSFLGTSVGRFRGRGAIRE